MHDFVLGAGWNHAGLVRLGTLLETHQHDDLGIERAAIELDRFFCATVEKQIRLDVHGGFLFDSLLNKVPNGQLFLRGHLLAQALFLLSNLGRQRIAEVVGLEHLPDFEL